MPSDLVSACVFCAGLLFGSGTPSWPGFSAEIGLAYATAARGTDLSNGQKDVSDTTPKFLLVGAGQARDPVGSLGAGTPSAEWRLRVALAPSHDEQEQTPFTTSNVGATGTGRYENFALEARLPLGEKYSVEAGWDRRTHKATDLVSLGGERHVFGEERSLNAERVDLALGLRRRWEGLEAAVSIRATRPAASTVTSATFRIAGDWMPGAAVEARMRRGPWTAWVRGERVSGGVSVHEESAPDFVSFDSSPRATFEAVQAGAIYSRGATDVLLSGTLDRSRLPFVSFAPLGVETAAFGEGIHADSSARQYFALLSVRRQVAQRVRAGALLRLGYGDETVVLSDPTGVRPTRRIDVKSSGVFGSGISRALGSPQVTLGLGAEFRLN
ncbi:MAG TPA: hypothetical protein VE007_06345 [Thermoanaerobaculia bacterium]|nr:hypothetical protein [Thermoanaerobaculia bacterium]